MAAIAFIFNIIMGILAALLMTADGGRVKIVFDSEDGASFVRTYEIAPFMAIVSVLMIMSAEGFSTMEIPFGGGWSSVMVMWALIGMFATYKMIVRQDKGEKRQCL